MMRRTSRLEDGSFFSVDRYFPFSFFFQPFWHKLLVKSMLKQFWWITIGLTLVGSLKWSSLFSITPLDSQKWVYWTSGKAQGNLLTPKSLCAVSKNRISDCNDCGYQSFTLFYPFLPIFYPKFFRNASLECKLPHSFITLEY